MRVGRFEEALQTGFEARELVEDALGPEHPRLGVFDLNIGSALMRSGRAEDALLRFGHALQILDPEHPSAASAMHNLGAVLLAMERYDEAAKVLQRAREALTRVLPPGHPDVLAARSAASMALMRSDPAAAIVELEAVVDAQSAALGESHSEVAITLTGLADAYLATHSWSEAVANADRARVMAEQTLGRSHPLVAEARIRAAGGYEGRGEYAEAEQEARAALAQASSVDPEVEARARFVLARALVGLGDDEAATPHLERSAELFDRLGMTGQRDEGRTWVEEHRRRSTGTP